MKHNTTWLMLSLTSPISDAFRSPPGDLAVWSFDLVLGYDGWIVRSLDPTPAFGGVWTAACSVVSGCTGWAS
ncbi:hypothetical protein TNIN_326081 [Trichonephila inaurata madagascariensis]|uniref:Secreted protein n=1 Tax=Trichonephila inaurata madagascariensis TaxID=2747483 RepID=A0A8X6M6V5_9ARAC|nr:hypothetical protein TNIN_326081 [Trichonephila inaurata madagascariensis]